MRRVARETLWRCLRSRRSVSCPAALPACPALSCILGAWKAIFILASFLVLLPDKLPALDFFSLLGFISLSDILIIYLPFWSLSSLCQYSLASCLKLPLPWYTSIQMHLYLNIAPLETYMHIFLFLMYQSPGLGSIIHSLFNLHCLLFWLIRRALSLSPILDLILDLVEGQNGSMLVLVNFLYPSSGVITRSLRYEKKS